MLASVAYATWLRPSVKPAAFCDGPDEERDRAEADGDPHAQNRVDQQRIDDAAARVRGPCLHVEAERNERDRLEDGDDEGGSARSCLGADAPSHALRQIRAVSADAGTDQGDTGSDAGASGASESVERKRASLASWYESSVVEDANAVSKPPLSVGLASSVAESASSEDWPSWGLASGDSSAGGMAHAVTEEEQHRPSAQGEIWPDRER